jgi:hypothetical protein
MNIADEVQEIITTNGPRIKAMFRMISRRAKLYKRARNVWTLDLVEEQALETLLVESLTRHLESGADQTIVTGQFYALLVRGRCAGKLEMQVLHPMAERFALPESYEPAERMIDVAFDDRR